MLYLDTCVLLAVLTPEVHSARAAAFLSEASAPLAISAWSVTELHSALGLKVRTKTLSQAQAETVLNAPSPEKQDPGQSATGPVRGVRRGGAWSRQMGTLVTAGSPPQDPASTRHSSQVQKDPP